MTHLDLQNLFFTHDWTQQCRVERNVAPQIRATGGAQREKNPCSFLPGSRKKQRQMRLRE